MPVTVMRGGLEESRHTVHVAVVDRCGRLVASAGDPDRLTTLRSAAKPYQLQPLVERGGCDAWDDEIVAVCCASHMGLDAHVDALRRGFARAGVDEESLRNAGGDVEARLRHNCSGNHLGFLALCRLEGWSLDGYRAPDHPSQRAALAAMRRCSELADEDIATCTDGCGVVCFAMPLRAIAGMYARMLSDLPRQATAMRAPPEMVRGPGALDTELMRSLPGCVAKTGAEALECLCLEHEGLGVAVRVEDGASRALDPAVVDVLGQVLGWAQPPDGLRPFREPAVVTARGETAGTIKSTVQLTGRSAGSP